MKVIVFLLSLCVFTGCMQLYYSHPDEYPNSELPIAEQISSLEAKVQSGSTSFEEHYALAGLYTRTNQLDKALEEHKKVLQLKPDHHETYVSMKNILRIESTDLRDKMLAIEEAKNDAKGSGTQDLATIMQRWDDAIQEKIRLYLIEADMYLLYDNVRDNISDFPEVEAHIRDVQDLWKERWESKQQESQEKKTINDPIYTRLQDCRSALAIKQAKTLLAMSQEFDKEEEIIRSIDMLRDADAQIAKFYPEEEPTAEMVLLVTNENIDSLARQITNSLYQEYEKELEIEQRNKEHLLAISEYQEAQDAQKQIEQTLENMIQLKLVGLWRYDKLEKTKANLHESMIPLYERLISVSQESLKSGEYHYRLARYYHEHGNKQAAIKHAKIAEEILGGYRVKTLLEQVSK